MKGASNITAPPFIAGDPFTGGATMTAAISGHDGSAGTPAFAGATANSGINFSGTATRISVNGSDLFQFSSSARLGLEDNSAGIIFGGLTQSANTPCLFKTAHNIIGQHNSTNAQESQLYQTYTSGSIYARHFNRWSGTDFQAGIEAAGGESVGKYQFYIDGSLALDIWTTGLLPGASGDGLGHSARPWGNFWANGSTVVFSGLPTSDPAAAGQLWNDTGTVKISAG